jgi:D-amino-acid dehydrogenase
MKGEPDVVIVGGGAIGVASAYYLALRGAHVVVLEAGPKLGGEASYGNAGLISPSHCIPLASPGLLRRIPRFMRPGGAVYVRPRLSPALARFGFELARSCGRKRMLRGVRALRDLSRSSRDLVEDLSHDGLELGYERAGLMNVCRSEGAFEDLLRDVRLLRAEGFEPEVLDSAGARQREPLLREDIAGAVFWREDGHCDPSRLVAGLHTAAEGAGARFELQTPVTALERGADGSISAVRSASRVFRPRTVVLAAGAATPQLARMLGAKLPVEPGKGYHVQMPAGSATLHMPLIFQESVFAATPLGDRLRLAGTMEFVGWDLRPQRERSLRLLEEARGYLHGLDQRDDEVEAWFGMRPCTPDTLPVIGFSGKTPGLIYATGHGMLGITLAAATGLGVAQLALDRRSSLDLEPFSARRYRL